MVRALQKPLVATDASPPNTQAMAPFQAAAPRTSRAWVIAWAHPAAGVYWEPASPHMGSTTGPGSLGRLQTTPMSRPSLNPPDFPIGPAKASAIERPSHRTSGRER